MMTVHEILHKDTYPENLKALVEFRAYVSTCSTRAAGAGQLQLPRVHTEHATLLYVSRPGCLEWSVTSRAGCAYRQILQAKDWGRALDGRKRLA